MSFRDEDEHDELDNDDDESDDESAPFWLCFRSGLLLSACSLVFLSDGLVGSLIVGVLLVGAARLLSSATTCAISTTRWRSQSDDWRDETGDERADEDELELDEEVCFTSTMGCGASRCSSAGSSSSTTCRRGEWSLSALLVSLMVANVST